MLDVLNRYAHGFVVVPVVIASRKGGLLRQLQHGAATADELTASLGANSGHLQVTLRLLESLGWIDYDRELGYSATPELARHEQIADDLARLIDKDMAAYLKGGDGTFLRPYIERARDRWDASDGMLADFCDSLLLVPIVALLTKWQLLDELLPGNFTLLPKGVREEVRDILLLLGWIEGDESGYELTDPGRFMFERAMNLGVVESYRPMLAAMDDILFGDAEAIFGADGDGHELHVDRALNVIASGFMHDRFFAEVEGILISIFSREPFAGQPRYVADMGSGDGTFLRRVYETVRDKTPRGRVLDKYPLTLVGIDLNRASLEETSKTLHDIDHVVITGDIGDPARVSADLSAAGVDPAEVLHIRSFLDHDRPFIPPTDQAAIDVRQKADYLGAYVDRQGRAIPPAIAVQSLVEHLDRWSGIINEHGFILLEVHCQDPLVVREFKDQSESLYFDAIEGFSHQLLVEADAALMSAAEAGLFPRRDYFRKFPGVLPYCRITLNLFERRPYCVRMASAADLDALEALETACWPAAMRTSRDTLLRRIETYPLGQWVLEMDDDVVGVVYTQRIADIDALRESTLADVHRLHDPNGGVIQLLGLNVLPEKQHLGIGDQMLDLMLMRSALQGGVSKVAGLTRCKAFAGNTRAELQHYVEERDPSGRPADPILQFHHSHGAEFIGPVFDYRPEDEANLGAGILLCYDFAAYGTDLRVSDGANTVERIDTNADARTVVRSCLLTVLGAAKKAAFAWDRSLRDIGLDSLGLLEFRTVLQRSFERELSPTFFFAHPTPAAIAAFLESSETDATESTAIAPSPAVELRAAAAEAESPAPSPVTPLQADADDIAIVGMAGRFPGGSNLGDYWDLLAGGGDAISEVPASRWDVDAFYDADPDAPGKTVTRLGGFLPGVDEFDGPFFGIAPSEAKLMDPQQRILMEIHWEALEDAAIDADTLRNAPCGVFVGLYSHDYEILQVAAGNDADLGAYYATGNSASIAAGRVAYFLGTRGPALTIDTACSSSLVAVHQAVQALRAGQCNVALASGASLILSPRLSVIFSKAGMLAPDGHCKTFDARADGYVRSEGCGAVVLKRLADARRDGNRIHAVIKGSHINQDGASNGLTAPNMDAQAELLQGALADARLSPADIDYIEAHGTGTNLGDPVEYAALCRVFGADPDRREPLAIGSAKTNIGHAEAAAGIAGLLKLVLAMSHEMLPAHINYEQTNPLIDLDALPARIPSQTAEWQGSGRPLRAGVSSFGFSGTNAHVIVEQERGASVARDRAAARAAWCVPLSAKSEPALAALADRYVQWLSGQPDDALPAIARTAAAGRTHHAVRLAAIGSNVRELAEALKRRAAEPTRQASDGAAPKIAFMFTGQGSQYVNMARELALSEPVFRQELQRCQEILESELEVPLQALLFPAEEDAADAARRLDDTTNTQPALFAIEYALARLLQSWGIRPAAVIGHSVGEYVAACIAGVFSLEDGLKLIAARGRLMGSLPAGGGMTAMLGDPARVVAAIEGNNDVSIAAFNSPENTVVAGPLATLERISAELEREGLKAVPLQVSHAFHSPLMESVLPAFREITRWVKFEPPQIGFISNVSGEFAAGEVTRGDYWVSHIRSLVRFHDGIKTLLASGCDTIVEIGPHPVLTVLGQATEEATPYGEQVHVAHWIATLVRGESDARTMAAATGRLYELGCALDWHAIAGPGMLPAAAIPTYPWQRKRYWFRDTPPATAGTVENAAAPLLFEPVWLQRTVLDADLPARHAARLPAQQDLDRRVAEARHNARGEYKPGTFAADADALCVYYVRDALRTLGWRPAVGDVASAAGIIESCGLLASYERLVHRLLSMLVEDGYLRALGDDFEVCRDLQEVTRQPDIALPAECRAESRLLQRCGERLADVLRGDIGALELLFPDGSLEDAVSVYTDSPFATVANTMVRTAVDSIVDGLAPDETLRILEIGAGTGGTTASLLPRLPAHQTEYVFTDLSEVFLDKAEEKFADFPFVRYALLDIEKPVAGQGICPGQFDLVIASNVLHATLDLQASVANAAALLSEGGMLLLVEGLEKTRWVDLVFGLTEGWWRFADPALRTDYPLLDPARWRELLQRCGLADVSVPGTTPEGAVKDSPADLFNQAVVMARSPGPAPARVRKPQAVAGTAPRTWYVLADADGAGEALAERLANQGESCELIFRGVAGLAHESAHAVADAAALPALFEKLSAVNDHERNVVDLWSLEFDGARDDADGNALAEAAVHCGMQRASVARAAAGAGLHSLYIVSRGGRIVVADDGLRAAPASVSGIANVARAEYPRLAVRHVDLDPAASPADSAALLAADLLGGDPQERIVYRKGQRSSLSLVPVPDIEADLACAADAVYLVIGGMGDIGMHTARYLVGRGARRLVLAGRTDFPPRAEWDQHRDDPVLWPKLCLVDEMEQAGAELQFAVLDITDPEEVSALVARLAAWGPLRGVVQAAAVIADQLIDDVDAESYAGVLGPKVAGTLNLLQAIDAEALDFCLFYSSIGSVVGLPGQVSYAAANAFLDEAARACRQKGWQALSINWCGWLGTGLARTAGGRRAIAELELLGIRGLHADQAVQQVGKAIRHGAPQVVTIPLLPAGGQLTNTDGLDPLLVSLRRRFCRDVPRESADIGLPAALEQPAAMRPPANIEELEHTVITMLADLLDIDHTRIVADTSLGDLGMDSLLGLEFRKQLQARFGIVLSATLVWNFPTVKAIVQHVGGKAGLSADDKPAKTKKTDSVAHERAPASPVDDLSDEEAYRLLVGQSGDR